MFEQLGCSDVRTLLQSGNAVFAPPRRTNAQTLERRLEAEAQRCFGFDIAFMLRGAAEWQSIVADNPFPAAARSDPGRLVVMALKGVPSPAGVKALRDGYAGPETLEIRGRNAYLIYPDGQGRSKLTNALIERRFGVAGTARNWNTVLKLAALAGV
jgi:uncharacterized protein (DUF1697 family)